MIYPNKYILATLVCRKCGIQEKLRRKSVEDKESLVGKTWNIPKMVVKCISCNEEQSYEDYLVSDEIRNKWIEFITKGAKHG